MSIAANTLTPEEQRRGRALRDRFGDRHTESFVELVGWRTRNQSERVENYWSTLAEQRELTPYEKYQREWNFIETEYSERPSNNGLDLMNPGFAYSTKLAKFIVVVDAPRLMRYAAQTGGSSMTNNNDKWEDLRKQIDELRNRNRDPKDLQWVLFLLIPTSLAFWAFVIWYLFK